MMYGNFMPEEGFCVDIFCFVASIIVLLFGKNQVYLYNFFTKNHYTLNDINDHKELVIKTL